MTQQFPEILRFHGVEYYSDEHPLGACLREAGILTRFENTAMRRGYQGHWEVRQGKLHLTALSGLLADGQRLTLQTVFPGNPSRIADWYSGELRASRGASTLDIESGLPTSWEYELCLLVTNGEVSRSVQRRNSVCDSPQVLDLRIHTTDLYGYVVGALGFSDLMRLVDNSSRLGVSHDWPDGSAIFEGGTFEEFPGPISIDLWCSPPAERTYRHSHKTIWKIRCEFEVASESRCDRVISRKVCKAGRWERERIPHKLAWISVASEVAEERIVRDLTTALDQLDAHPQRNAP